MSPRKKFFSREIQHLLIAWLVLGVCFSVSGIYSGGFFLIFPIALTTLGLGFICHELSHRYIARKYGYSAEFQIWWYGLILALFMAFVSGGRIIFAAPGAVYIMPAARYYTWDYTIEKKEMGRISIAGPLANIAVAGAFFMLTDLGGILGYIGLYGFRINIWLAAFNLLPFGPLDGRKIFSWNPIIWAIITIPLWIINFFNIV